MDPFTGKKFLSDELDVEQDDDDEEVGGAVAPLPGNYGSNYGRGSSFSMPDKGPSADEGFDDYGAPPPYGQINGGASSRPGSAASQSTAGAAESPENSDQLYQQRLARARDMNLKKRQDRMSSTGMVVSNLEDRPMSRQMSASSGLFTPYDPQGGQGSRQQDRDYDQQKEPAGSAEKRMISEGIKPVFDPNANIDLPPVIDTKDHRAFLMRPGGSGAPGAGMIQCYIQRSKVGMAKFFPCYQLFMKDGDGPGKDKFLLSARKRKKNRSSNYLISLDRDDLSRQSGNYFGKLRANFIGTEFVLYDKGTNPEKVDPAQLSASLVNVRQELAVCLYKQNVLGSRGPRKMKVMLPDVRDDGTRHVLRPQKSDESMLERYKASKTDQDVLILKNKPPKWNEQVGAYVLNFNGRVTQASVKNFQLINPARDAELVLMQFGRVGKDVFTIDYQYPLSALQAFGIALSSFDYKIACE